MDLTTLRAIVSGILEDWCYFAPSVLLNMTLTGSVAILCVLILRLILKNVPKTLTFLLWTVVLFRLICPVSFALPVSLYSVFETDIREEAVIEYIPTDIVFNPYPKVNLPMPDAVNDAINAELPYGAQQVVADPLEGEAAIFSEIWLIGAAVMVLWNLIEYIVLRIRLMQSEKLEKGIYETDRLDTAIVTGLLFHRIWLPAGLDAEMRQCVIAHEKQHIRRGDPWFKFLFFIALVIHWYNPLVWIAFRYAVRDMEMACDEGVLRKMGEESRQFYASALLSVAAGRRISSISPLAFGESDIKTRIRNVLSFGKTAKWIAAIAAVLVLAVTVVLAANPVKKPDVYEASYKVAGTLNYQEMTNYEPYRVTVTEKELIVMDDAKTELCRGQLVKSTGLVNYVHAALEDKMKFVDEVYVAWSDETKTTLFDDRSYLIRTKNGEIWLAMDRDEDPKHRDWGIYLLEPNGEEPDELYFLAMIESYGGPRAQLMSTWQSEKFLSGETWYIVGYRTQGTIGLNNDKNPRWQMGYATFRMKDGQYRMTANRRYFVEETLPGVMLCDDPASLSVDYNLAKESYDVLFVLDDSVTQLDQKLNGRDYTRVWVSSTPAMVVVPYEKEGITYTATYADGTEQTWGEAAILTGYQQTLDTAYTHLAMLLQDREEKQNSLAELTKQTDESLGKQADLIMAKYLREAPDTGEELEQATAKMQEEIEILYKERKALDAAAENLKKEITVLNQQIEEQNVWIAEAEMRLASADEITEIVSKNP